VSVAAATPRSAAVYDALLTRGCVPADRLADDLSIPRADARRTLEALVARGLAEAVEDGYVAL
jgi:predicted ArsR family transcriptional regulator